MLQYFVRVIVKLLYYENYLGAVMASRGPSNFPVRPTCEFGLRKIKSIEIKIIFQKYFEALYTLFAYIFKTKNYCHIYVSTYFVDRISRHCSKMM